MTLSPGFEEQFADDMPDLMEDSWPRAGKIVGDRRRHSCNQLSNCALIPIGKKRDFDNIDGAHMTELIL